MKKVLWGLGIVVVSAGLFGLGWISHGVVDKAPAGSPTSAGAPVSSIASGNPAANTPPPTPRAPLVSSGEFQQLRAARDAALQANPDLAAEYKQIISALQAEQNQLDADMIKADPKVAPIVAKLVALRQRNGAHTLTAAPGPR